jgi:hypothetical protein
VREHLFVKHRPLPAHQPLVSRTGRPPSANRTRPAGLRECPRHGLTEFGHYSGRSTQRYRWKCKRCIAEAVTRRHQLVRQTLVEEAGSACAICGYDRCIVSLHFHHVDPTTKRFPMTMESGQSIATMRAEAKKCVLLCANCHGEVEAGVTPSPPAGTRYGRAS